MLVRLRQFLIAAVLLLGPSPAEAHPHVWVDAASEVLFDDLGRIAAIRHHWRFDEAFSAYALQGLDSDGDGKYSRAELAPLAQENVESLFEFDFFTFLSVGDDQAGFTAPGDYYVERDAEGWLILHFTLPLAAPLLARSAVALEIYDPEYFVAFSLPSAEAVRLVDAPEGCRLTVHPGSEPDAAAAAALATIGPDQRALPSDMKSLTAGIENSAEIDCGGLAGARSPAEAATRMAAAGGVAGDLTALSAAPSQSGSPLSAAPPRASEPRPGPSAFALFVGRIAVLQAAFSRDLTEALKGLKSGGAFWWLGGLSFLYGVVHAAGPGHGKVVISSYLVANESHIRRGVAIAFVAAFGQALVAVALIGIMAVLLDMTSMAITGAAKAFEAGSFALVAALGLFLLARKGRQALTVLHRGADARHGHDDARHGHDDARHAHRGDFRAGCAHHHHVAPGQPAAGGLAGAASAVLSVAVRPCSGALVVLVFALAQGIFWAGVASTFMMALGTALTVAALAALAVGAKDAARWLAGGDARWSATLMLGVEFVAALLIAVLGAVLFLGAVAA